MNRYPRSITASIVITFLAAALGCAAPVAQDYPNETWMGMYVGQMKVGYAHMYADKAEFEGKPGYRMESTSVVKAPLMGEQVEQNINTVVHLNSSYVPVYETFRMSSSGVATTVTARFAPTEITAEMDSGGTKTTTKIPIPPGSKLIAEEGTFHVGDTKLKVGDKMSLKSFNPLMLTLDDVQVEVVREEDLVIDGSKHHCLVVKSASPMGNATSWEDEKEDILKVEMDMGFTMIRETMEVAMSGKTAAGTYVPPSDLAVVTSAQTSTKILVPSRVKYMKVRLDGFSDKSLEINDSRQKVTFADGENPSAVYEITAKDFDPMKATLLPIKEGAVTQFLTDGPYIQITDPKIRAAAEQIVGDEKNSFRAASLIRDWVSTSMRTKADIGIVRSASEILVSKVGVCRDYAILYTALARAAGIPTKLVTGMTYWQNGLYYHAWAESFVGEWIPMDATLDADFVDATHLKLAEGDATAMFRAIKAVGKLKAGILEYK